MVLKTAVYIWKNLNLLNRFVPRHKWRHKCRRTRTERPDRARVAQERLPVSRQNHRRKSSRRYETTTMTTRWWRRLVHQRLEAQTVRRRRSGPWNGMEMRWGQDDNGVVLRSGQVKFVAYGHRGNVEFIYGGRRMVVALTDLFHLPLPVKFLDRVEGVGFEVMSWKQLHLCSHQNTSENLRLKVMVRSG